MIWVRTILIHSQMKGYWRGRAFQTLLIGKNCYCKRCYLEANKHVSWMCGRNWNHLFSSYFHVESLWAHTFPIRSTARLSLLALSMKNGPKPTRVAYPSIHFFILETIWLACFLYLGDGLVKKTVKCIFEKFQSGKWAWYGVGAAYRNQIRWKAGRRIDSGWW